MIAPYRQPPLPDLASRVTRDTSVLTADAARARRVAWLMGILGFWAFVPYPAINAGNYTAIQIGNILTFILALPLIFAVNRSRLFHVYLLLLVPLCLTCLKTAIVGDGDLDLSLKVIAVSGITFLIIPVVQTYGATWSLWMLTGIAIATILHTAIGLWQMHGFSAGYFPLTGLYINNSFLSVQENVTTIYRYIQRPFGLFPEPSAMSSSLAPWVLLWIACMCNIIRLRKQPARWQRILFGTAAFCGLALIIISRSGHAAVTLAAALVFLGIWFVRSRATPQNSIALFVVFGVLMPLVLWQASLALSDRLGGASPVGNSSWEDRSSSLIAGVKLLLGRDPATILFGFGAGQTSPVLLEHTGLEAVWSVVLTYLYETGMVGLVFSTCIALMMLHAWRQSGQSIVFAAFAGVWFVGVMVTTSYSQLLPLWIAMAWLMIWPQVCETVPHRNPLSTLPRARIHTRPRMYANRISRWEPSANRAVFPDMEGLS